jgi:MFS transporter, DHA2 family, multidrug resistance protein
MSQLATNPVPATSDPAFPRVLGIQYKWVAAAVVMVGVFMTLLDTTIVDITLPKMIAELATDTLGIEWVVITYLVGSAISMATAGYLGDRLGHKRTYIIGMAIFAIASAFCGQAWDMPAMNVSRLIQGFGEGLVVPIGMTVLYEVFPARERGLAMGIYALGASFAPALGPALGGLLTEHFNWRWIFYVNLPVSVAGVTAAAFLLLPHKPTRQVSNRFDLFGFLSMSCWVSAFIIFLTKGQKWGWWGSDLFVALVLLFVVSLLAFLLWEHRRKDPLIEIHLFRNSTFTLVTLIT